MNLENKMEGVNVYIPPELKREVEGFRAGKGLENISQAARMLIRIGLEKAVKEKGVEVAV
jgi:hypothetical protein